MPTATIDLSAISHNVSRLKRHLSPGTQMLAALKADAYGHGAGEVGKHLETLGVGWFGLATPEEALALREAGVRASLLLFSPFYERLEEPVEQDVALTVVDEGSLEAVQRAAQKAGRDARVHLKIDTGMGRLGRGWREAVPLALTADRMRGVRLEGVWTHFSCADEADTEFTGCQIDAFGGFLSALERHGVEVLLRHAANSSALIKYPESHFDMVRPGIALYGYSSSDHIESLEPHLKPAMTLTAPVTFVKRIKAGTPISYGANWTAPEDTRVATVRIGYADGYPRSLGNLSRVRIGNSLRPVVGRVCMDQLMVDVGGLEVQRGDRVTLFGPDGPTAEEVGRLCGTISYEILVGLGVRVTRAHQETR